MNTPLNQAASARALPDVRLIDVRTGDGQRHLYFAPESHIRELEANHLCEIVRYRSGQVRHVKLTARLDRGFVSTLAQANFTTVWEGDRDSNKNFQHNTRSWRDKL
jgi:hypothetical protein